MIFGYGGNVHPVSPSPDHSGRATTVEYDLRMLWLQGKSIFRPGTLCAIVCRMTVIQEQAQITPAWVEIQLQNAGLDTEVHALRIEVVDENRFSKKWRLHLDYTGDGPSTLFFKYSHLTREARFYYSIRVFDHDLPVVPCYDTAYDETGGHILLLDLSETHETRPPAQLPPYLHETDRIIDGLADLHAYWWDHPRLAEFFGPMPLGADIRAAILNEDVPRYERFANFLGDRLLAWQRDIFAQIMAKLPDLLALRYTHHLTLTFEDVHIGNFLYPRNPSDELYFIDWEQWGINAAMNDLAYMMAMFWSPARRQALEVPYLKRYHARLNGRYTWDALWDDYRLFLMRHLLSTVPWQWEHHAPTDVWWNHLERLTAAYLDLNCADILDQPAPSF